MTIRKNKSSTSYKFLSIPWNPHLPSFILISPIAQVALLHTDIYSGFKFWPRIGKKLDIWGCTCWKQAFVRSPSKANDDCLTSGMVSCMQRCSNCMMLLFSTNFSICPLRPSANPDSKSRATIIKSLSGASNCSGFWILA